MTLGKMRKRSIRLFVFFLALLVIIISRLFYWQIVRGNQMKEAAERQQTNQTAINARRGTIYDRNQNVLAESATVNTVVCNPQQIEKDCKDEEGDVRKSDLRLIASTLAEILDLDEDDVFDKITKENKFQYIKKRVTVEEADAIKKLKDSSADKQTAKLFSGVYFEEDSKRYYQYNLASHIIGFTGYDNDGMQGIEMTFNNYLSGRAGTVLSARNAGGTTAEKQYEADIDAQKGDDIVLTIDETIQSILEKYLEQACVENVLKEGACGIIMNPKTGEILAMATKPDFDLNDPTALSQYEKFAIGMDDVIAKTKSENTEERNEAIAQIRNKMWRNKAISDTYEPGSTFKILTAAIALEEGAADLNSQFYCGGAKQVADRKIKCHKVSGHGAEDFARGVINSCNVVFMDLGLRIGSEKFQEYFKAFGLTKKTGIELIGESGSVYYKNRMSETDIATSSFGQGFSITPIQLIRAISAVINGGNLMRPQIVKEIRNAGGIVKSFYPQVENKVISEQTSAAMRNILERVVADPNGTGKNAYIKGYRIGGKTGTSEKGRNNGKRIASFVGFAPADDPQIICLVMLDEPQVANKYGGTIAAPLVGSIIEETLEYMGIDRQYTEAEAQSVSVTVPDVREQPINSAKEMIAAKGLNIKVSGNGETVLDQLPKPGVSVAENSTIIVYTQERDENKKVAVPNLEGLTAEQAKKRLTDAGLNFEVGGAGLAAAEGAYAFRQSIPAGTLVEPATVVSVEFRHSSSD